MITQDDIDNRRQYIKDLLDKGQKLDYKALAQKFNCSTDTISADKGIVTKAGGVGVSFIYALSDKTGVRYIGQATNPRTRYGGHISKAQNGSNLDCSKWIRSLLEQGENPIITIIETCPRNQAGDRENYWIRYYKKQGCNLVNMPLKGKAYPLCHCRTGIPRGSPGH